MLSYLILSSLLVNPIRETIITVVILKITETTPTIAIFCNKVIFFFNANIDVSRRHPKLQLIRTRFPVELSSCLSRLSYKFMPAESLSSWQIKDANITWKHMVIPQGYIIIQIYDNLLSGVPYAAYDISPYDLYLYWSISLTINTIPIIENKPPRNINNANGITPI